MTSAPSPVTARMSPSTRAVGLRIADQARPAGTEAAAATVRTLRANWRRLSMTQGSSCGLRGRILDAPVGVAREAAALARVHGVVGRKRPTAELRAAKVVE